ncbi:MAG: alpha-L-arabinofuranosidase [Pedobacter sp.]|nr:MAG: alpha-L-arabinofuranosidase [Pedobacter sp.]
MRLRGILMVAGMVVLFAYTSCKKSKVTGTDDTPVDPPSDTSVTPPTEVAVAASVGFFMDEWEARTFAAPTFSDVAKPAAAANVSVTVDYSQTLTKVSKYLFGNNANPYIGQMVTEPVLINHLKTLSPNVIRFPGGNISSVYFWNARPGEKPADVPNTLYDSSGNPVAESYWFGKNNDGWTLSVDNYYAMLQQTGSKGIITINYAYARYGTSEHPDRVAAHHAAEWVRADKGKTKLWEIGNESSGPWQAGWKIDVTKNKDGQPEIITGEIYGKHFKVFADSMRKAATEVGAQIKIGAQLVQHDPVNSWNNVDKTWNNGYFAAAGDYADFYIVHDYYTQLGENTNAVNILNSPVQVSKSMMDWMKVTTQRGGVPMKPIALTEWNIGAEGSKQMVSHLAGIHAVMVFGELIKNEFGMAARWDIANGYNNGNDHGMFSLGDENNGTLKWSPRPAFYYQYYFQRFLGDRMVSSAVSGSADVHCYASGFTSGEAGIVLVNKGTSAKVAEVSIKNFRAGTRYYYYTLTGGTDNGDFSAKVLINDNGPAGAAGGPSGYQTLLSRSANLSGGMKVSLPARSVVFIAAEAKK